MKKSTPPPTDSCNSRVCPVHRQNEDPVREAELNIRRFERLERRAQQLESQLKPLQARHDAMGVLELLE